MKSINLNPEATELLKSLLADVVHDVDDAFTQLAAKYTRQAEQLIRTQEGANADEQLLHTPPDAEAEATVLVALGAVYTAVVRAIAERSPFDALNVMSAAAHLAQHIQLGGDKGAVLPAGFTMPPAKA